MRGVTKQKSSSAEVLVPFQLTRLMRGVTAADLEDFLKDCNFNSHASCEA